MLTLKQLTNQEIMSLVNSPKEKFMEVDNSEGKNIFDVDWSISSVFNIIKILSNYMALNYVSSETNFEKLGKNTVLFVYNKIVV